MKPTKGYNSPNLLNPQAGKVSAHLVQLGLILSWSIQPSPEAPQLQEEELRFGPFEGLTEAELGVHACDYWALWIVWRRPNHLPS